MKNKEELKEELEGLSPFLTKMKEEGDGFKVPADYFKTLPDEVLNKVQRQGPAVERSSWFDGIASFLQMLWQPKYVLAVASAAAILIAAVCFFKKDTPKEEVQPIAAVQVSDIPFEELHEYLSDNIADIDENLIVEASLSTTESQTTKTTILPKATTEELEGYLDDVIDEIDPKDLEDLF
ncbi:MAG: hypothetical protein R2830_01645 [Saprospiraceae bacterium]